MPQNKLSKFKVVRTDLEGDNILQCYGFYDRLLCGTLIEQPLPFLCMLRVLCARPGTLEISFSISLRMLQKINPKVTFSSSNRKKKKYSPNAAVLHPHLHPSSHPPKKGYTEDGMSKSSNLFFSRTIEIHLGCYE